MAPRARWNNLHSEALHRIYRHIPCKLDRVRMLLVCRAWRASLRHSLPLPPQLPWLLVPSPREPTFSCLLGGCGSVGGGANELSVHCVGVPADLLSARFFGSYDGGWLFLARRRNSSNMLLNLHTGRRIPIPDVVRSPRGMDCAMIMLAATVSSPPSDTDDPCFGAANELSVHRVGVPVDLLSARFFGSYDGGWLFLARRRNSSNMLLNLRTGRHIPIPDVVRSPRGMDCAMIMLAATVSSPPSDTDDPCFGAAIIHSGPNKYNRRQITFWRMACHMTIHPNPKSTGSRFFAHDHGLDDMRTATLSSPPEHGHCVVAAMCCFVSMLPAVDVGELQGLGLGGRMLFVGRGCSRSYTAPPSVPKKGQAWMELREELLEVVLSFIPCLIHRIYVSATCLSWRAGFASHLASPPHLPLLALPWRRKLQLELPLANAVKKPAVFCFVHNVVRPLSNLPKSRCLSSYEGGWIFCAKDETNQMLNLNSMQSIPLPNSASIWDGRRIFVTLITATLSCSPPPVIGADPPPNLRCLGAAIVSSSLMQSDISPSFIIWFLGEDSPLYLSMRSSSQLLVDVIYYQEAFHFLDSNEDLVKVNIHFDEEGNSVAEEMLYFMWRGIDEDHVICRYVVESRGDLLMVVRFSHGPQTPVSSFRIFRMERLPQPVLYDGIHGASCQN